MYDPKQDILPHIIVVGLILLGVCFLCGCEEDDGKNVPELEDLPPGSYVIEGNVERSVVESVNGSVYVGGNVEDSRGNTAPAPAEKE